MTTPRADKDPKHTLDPNGVLGEPRFVPQPPGRVVTGSERLSAIAHRHVPVLKANPGKWAAVFESESKHPPKHIITLFRGGKFGLPSLWKTAVRFNPDTKRHVVYVSYRP